MTTAQAEPVTAAQAEPVTAAQATRRHLGPVVSIGAHILDVLGRPVTEIPSGQGSATLEEIRVTAAGTAAGTSVDLARLGVAVKAFGAIGDDVCGELLVMLMERAGVDTSLVVRKAGTTTSATILPIRPDGSRPALHCPGATGLLAADDVGPLHLEAVEAAAVVHVGGPDAMGRFAGRPLRDLLLRARRHSAIVTLDVLGSGGPAQLERIAPLLSLADWFLPNEEQLQALTGELSLERAIAAVRRLGTVGIAVTRGASGCVIDDGAERVQLPAIGVEVVDTTGCGDGFDAGFITALLLGCSPVDSAWVATACGALVATGLGSDAGITGVEVVMDLIEASAPGVARRISADLSMHEPMTKGAPR